MRVFFLVMCIVLCVSCTTTTGFEEYVKADRQTYEIVAKDYTMMLEEHEEDLDKRSRKIRLLESWRVRIEKAEEFLEETKGAGKRKPIVTEGS